jgi:diphthine-ammonia ligase
LVSGHFNEIMMGDQLTKKKAIVSWTGGKDCALSLFMARQSGLEIAGLVTFIPACSDFRAHPLTVIEKQAEALNLTWTKIVVKKPYERFYELSLEKVKRIYDIEYLITGDIDFIGGFSTNYMEERCQAVGLNIFNPVWQKSRDEIWELLFENKFEIIFSLSKASLLSASWIGKSITKKIFTEFKNIAQANGIDLCGENGEFHSIVINSPDFRKKLILKSSRIISDDEFHYLDIEKISLKFFSGDNDKNTGK